MVLEKSWISRRGLLKRDVSQSSEPIVVPVTQEYNGNDGPWSSFAVRIGTPHQAVKLLASTSSAETWIVSTEGCAANDRPDCPVDRGLLFDSRKSSTWHDWNDTNIYPLDNDRRMPYDGTGSYGYDSITLGWSEGEGQALPSQIIAKIKTKDFDLGMLGLSGRPIKTSKRKDSHTGNLSDLKAKGLIPSISYGYTAGSKSRRQSPQQSRGFASLVLGGYDKTLLEGSPADFKMGNDSGRDLSVNIRSISLSTKSKQDVPLASIAIPAIIDSAISHYWLPPEICKAFETAFGLVYDPVMELYLINDTQHATLSAENPNVTFSLSSESSSEPPINITVPYQSFELRVNEEYPHSLKWNRYFPLRKAFNPSHYTLGRAFLQDSYLIANYESGNFSITPRKYTTEKAKIVAIRDPKAKPGGDEIPGPAKSGIIATGCIIATVLLVFLVWRCVKRRRRLAQERDNLESQSSTIGKSELDGKTIYELDKSTELYELNGISTLVEAPNPDVKEMRDDYSPSSTGPFELPAESLGSAIAARNRRQPSHNDLDDSFRSMNDLVSPIDGTIGSGHHTISSTGQTLISPIEQPSPVREKN